MPHNREYWESLIVRKDGKPMRKLDIKEALALYPQKNPETLGRDIRRAWAKAENRTEAPRIAIETALRPGGSVDWLTGKVKTTGERFVILFDLHYPYQVFQSQIMEFLKDFKPDTLVYGGDQINADPFNHWALTHPRQARNLPNPQPYYESANSDLFLPIRRLIPSAQIVAMYGNHEDWALEAIDDEPRGEGYWEPELNLEGIDVWVKPRDIINIGKLHIIHGDQIPGSGGVNPSRNLILRGYNRNVVAGHLHTYSVSTEISPIDANDRHIMEYSPCLTEFNPLFMQNQPHRWVNGFIYGYVEPNGNFYRETVIITNGRFMVGGKLYG